MTQGPQDDEGHEKTTERLVVFVVSFLSTETFDISHIVAMFKIYKCELKYIEIKHGAKINKRKKCFFFISLTLAISL